MGADAIGATVDYIDRYVDRGRSPADDALDAWHAGGRRAATAVWR